jgi:hypothetical protein
VNLNRKRATPRSIGRASPPIVLPQPNGFFGSLALLLTDCVAGVERASIAEVRLVVFWAM